jgi:hypothetical protein
MLSDTRADELMLTTSIYGHRRSYELVAEPAR